MKLTLLSPLFLFVLSLFTFSRALWAFPNMVRLGYPSCTACHVSPNGQGLLTAYGQGIAANRMSMWGEENEGKSFWGVVDEPSWASFGGQVRAMQLFVENSRIKQGRFFVMQADLDAALHMDAFSLVGNFGFSQKRGNVSLGDQLLSRRHFLKYQLDDQWILRAGKFYAPIGIRFAEHPIATKQGVGFDANTETYNLEASYHGESFGLFLAAILGRPDKPELEREKGLALRGSFFFSQSYQLGLSYFYGSNDLSNRSLIGPFFILGITDYLYVTSEIFYQRKNMAGVLDPQTGFASYFKLGLEWTQGLHTFATLEYLNLDMANTRGSEFGYGLGLQFFPRPHFEVLLQYEAYSTELEPQTTHLSLLLHTYF